ncbi:MAG: ATP-binding protein [Candidatus Woesebacteria bacterium]|nr:ATP-binding protein [Candidatus Woesebacteria bacterium]
MFQKARIKLTAFYLAIIMLISISFSVVIYQGSVMELNRIEQIQRFRRPSLTLPGIEPDIIEETRGRIIFALSLINLIILGVSGTAGYFLAGRTLKPISEMLENQKLFVSDASHELRTPLTSMKTEIEVALRSKDLDLKETKNLLFSNLEEVNKMQKLANYLLELNKYQSGNGKLSFGKVNLKSIAEKAIKEVQRPVEAKKIKIINKLQNAYVTGNEESLVQLAVILLDNAIKYSLPGKEIIVKTGKTATAGVMEFKDFGLGIRKEDLPHIFERFYRVDISRSKEKTDGYGLGLSIADGIAKLNNGSIKVESKEGKGSIFIVRI